MTAQPAGKLLHFGLTSPLLAGVVIMAICLASGWAISKLLPPPRRPVVEIIDVPGPVVSEGAAKTSTAPTALAAPAALDLTMAPARESLTLVQSWAFESEADTTDTMDRSTARSKGNKRLDARPDLRGAPQGWAYEASANE
jgi:hypothetical protein